MRVENAERDTPYRTTRDTSRPLRQKPPVRDWRDLRPSVLRGLQSGDSSEDDVPTPEEVDPTIHDDVCDADFVLDECVDDGQPYCDAP